MNIVLCGSIQCIDRMRELEVELTKLGHSVESPMSLAKRLYGEELTEYNPDTESEKKKNDNLIRKYFHLIKTSDAILVVNEEKNGITNYIGSNTFLEIGFAYVLEKRIFLLNDIPDMLHTDEIRAMNPVCLQGNIKSISSILT
jgi:nucleoside 2-deoxyribosyltransferase